ncbi:hypothetical protein C8R44DRAFT_725567 [Mycena epipterygia]|nr:hypothetical protein C8R44DRAFT_725567 [Mycena epipterygia]
MSVVDLLPYYLEGCIIVEKGYRKHREVAACEANGQRQREGQAGQGRAGDGGDFTSFQPADRGQQNLTDMNQDQADVGRLQHKGFSLGMRHRVLCQPISSELLDYESLRVTPESSKLQACTLSGLQQSKLPNILVPLTSWIAQEEHGHHKSSFWREDQSRDGFPLAGQCKDTLLSDGDLEVARA